MEYRKIVSVTGLSGLYELVSSRGDGGVVRSLDDKTTKFVSNRIHSFSQLEGIEIFTTDENVNLVEIFDAFKASKEALPGAAYDNKAVKAYFEKVYPAMDFSRVYASDMKKMVKWFGILKANDVEIKLSENPDIEAGVPENKPRVAEAKTAAVKNNAPAKKINTPRKMA